MYIYNIICAALYDYDYLSLMYMYACDYVYMYMYMCVCTCIYVCICMCVNPLIHRLLSSNWFHGNIYVSIRDICTYTYYFYIFILIMEPWVIYPRKVHALKLKIVRVALLCDENYDHFFVCLKMLRWDNKQFLGKRIVYIQNQRKCALKIRNHFHGENNEQAYSGT